MEKQEETLSDKIRWDDFGSEFYFAEDVKDFIAKLKERGLEKTLYPKYLMLTIDDFKELAGEKLI